MRMPKMKYRYMVLLLCLSCATFTSVLILNYPDARLLPYLNVAGDSIGEARSYVMALRYKEQLTSGIRNALQLSHLFKEHGSQLVEPFIAGAQLYGLLPHGHPLSTVLDFSAVARECFLITDIASFDDFLQKSTRDIILVYPVSDPKPDSVLGTGRGQERHSAKDILPCLLDQGVCQCSKMLGDYARRIEQSLNVHLNGSKAMFRVRQIICINKLKPMTVGQFLKAAGLLETKVYSYIFTMWWGTSCSAAPVSHPSNTKYTIKARCPGTFRNRFIPETRPPGVCGKGNVDHSFISTKFLSPFVKELAAKFASSQRTGTGIKVSIHFRTEWLTVRYPDKVECCRTAVVDTLKNIIKTYQADNVLFVTDLGPFGSHSCDQDCRVKGKQLIQTILDATGLSPVHFDPVDYNVEEELMSGNVISPLVENAALSDAQVLVLIGGGKFQSSIVSSALLSSNLRHVYSVCSPSTLLDLPEGIVLHSNSTCT